MIETQITSLNFLKTILACCCLSCLLFWVYKLNIFVHFNQFTDLVVQKLRLKVRAEGFVVVVAVVVILFDLIQGCCHIHDSVS